MSAGADRDTHRRSRPVNATSEIGPSSRALGGGADQRALVPLTKTPSPVLEQLVAGDYAAGLDAYRLLADHSPDEERWFARCLLMLQRPLEAREVLLGARGRGCAAAAIEQAMVHRHLGEFNLARQTLAELDETDANPFDRALAARERGVLRYSLGDLDGALEAFEAGLRHAPSTPTGQGLALAIGVEFGRTLADKGQGARALHHLDAGLATDQAEKRVSRLGVRAECLIHLGRLEEARHDLEEAVALLHRLPMARPAITYLRGVHARARGGCHEALGILAEAVALAYEADELETELYARLECAAILTHLERLGEARSHLARARAISGCEKTDALVDWRSGALLARQADPEGIAQLERALHGFARLRLERECGWVRLYLAEAHARAGQTERTQALLEAATDTWHALGEGSGLFIELRALPKALEVLHTLPEGAYAKVLLNDFQGTLGRMPLNVELRTLGHPGLLADRQKPRLNAGLPVTVEVLAYLLLHPGGTLEQVLGQVAFPDPSPERAKSYFHLVRNELKQALPGVSIPFHSPTRTYAVDFGGVDAKVDFLELERLLASQEESGLLGALELYTGPFLPYSESDWARLHRERLEWALVNAALRVIETHFAAGRFERSVELAERVLEIVPTDIALNLCLVRAARAAGGRLAGHQVLERVRQRFLAAFGEVPPVFEAELSASPARQTEPVQPDRKNKP